MGVALALLEERIVPILWFAMAGFWVLIAIGTMLLGAEKATVYELAMAVVCAVIGLLVSLKDEEE